MISCKLYLNLDGTFSRGIEIDAARLDQYLDAIRRGRMALQDTDRKYLLESKSATEAALRELRDLMQALKEEAGDLV